MLMQEFAWRAREFVSVLVAMMGSNPGLADEDLIMFCRLLLVRLKCLMFAILLMFIFMFCLMRKGLIGCIFSFWLRLLLLLLLMVWLVSLAVEFMLNLSLMRLFSSMVSK